jgi:hypothetical protein
MKTKKALISMKKKKLLIADRQKKNWRHLEQLGSKMRRNPT